MKYQAKKNRRGKWAVFQGRKYFLSTSTDDELEAKQRALVMSMQWYEQQKDLAWDELKKISGCVNGDNVVKLNWSNNYATKSDLLA